MDCPNCKLVNPPNAARCDCGYDFQSRTIQQSYLTERDKRLRRGVAGGAGIGLLIYLAVESALRLKSEVVAMHSLGLAFLIVALFAVSLALWFWLVKNRRGS